MDAFVYIDDTFLGLVGVTAYTIKVVAFFPARDGRHRHRSQPRQYRGIPRKATSRRRKRFRSWKT